MSSVRSYTLIYGECRCDGIGRALLPRDALLSSYYAYPALLHDADDVDVALFLLLHLVLLVYQPGS